MSKELASIFRLSQKLEKEGIFHNSFYEASITLISKPDKDIIKKKSNQLHTNTTHEYIHQNPQQILAN